MTPGKAASQAGHAFLASYLKAKPDVAQAFISDAGGTKVVLTAPDEASLWQIYLIMLFFLFALLFAACAKSFASRRGNATIFALVLVGPPYPTDSTDHGHGPTTYLVGPFHLLWVDLAQSGAASLPDDACELGFCEKPGLAARLGWGLVYERPLLSRPRIVQLVA
jgi:hypothetical protein